MTSLREKVGKEIGSTAFPREKLPEITQLISDYAASVWPRNVIVDMPQHREKITRFIDDKDEGKFYDLLFRYAELERIPDLDYILDEELDRIFAREAPNHRTFQITTMSDDHGAIFTLNTVGSGGDARFKEKVDKTVSSKRIPSYDLRLAVEEAHKARKQITKLFRTSVRDAIKNQNDLSRSEEKEQFEKFEKTLDEMIKLGWNPNKRYRFAPEMTTSALSYATTRRAPIFIIEALLRRGSDPNEDPALFDDLLAGRSEPDPKEDEVIELLLEHGWQPLLSEGTLQPGDLETLRTEDPYIYGVIQLYLERIRKETEPHVISDIGRLITGYLY